ncbi:acyl-CoA thioesterase [Neobacillus niacini]|uniref:acyl-CoA thioesterase n=1 Tax=Neobacillus niacini TaxID=86668 RepID=UPI0027D923F3|nr:acyl-CoA thioesterase [Neobacillus niacini]
MVITVETNTEIRVKNDVIDELGHVNNSIYITYLEQARKEWYSLAGIPIHEMLKKSIGTVVLRLDIFFVKEAREGDILKIRTNPVRMGEKSFIFEQIIFNQAGEIITEATVTNVMFDLTERKSIPVIQEISRQFQSAMACYK